MIRDFRASIEECSASVWTWTILGTTETGQTVIVNSGLNSTEAAAKGAVTKTLKALRGE